MTHICVSELTIIGSDNGLSPSRRQAIIQTIAGTLLVGPLGTNFSEILIEINTFSFKKIHLKMSSGKCRPFCLGLNVLIWLCDVPHLTFVTSHKCDPDSHNWNATATLWEPFQNKDHLRRYSNFHHKDMIRPSNLFNGDPYTGLGLPS